MLASPELIFVSVWTFPYAGHLSFRGLHDVKTKAIKKKAITKIIVFLMGMY